MRKFLNYLLWIFLKPISAIIYFSGSDRYIRFVNRNNILKIFYIILLTLFFIFLFLFLPLIKRKYLG